MGLFDFAHDAGENLREALGGKKDLDAKALVKAIQDKGVTLENGQVSVHGDTVTVTGGASNRQEKELAVLILGNVKGVARVDDQIVLQAAPAAAATTASAPSAASAAQAQQPKFYVVKSGDTLSKIAQQAYGDANRYHEIFEANRPMLSDPDKIYPGQSLRLPN